MLTRFTTPRLGLILPAYNEQEVLPTTLSKFNTIKATLIQKISLATIVLLWLWTMAL